MDFSPTTKAIIKKHQDDFWQGNYGQKVPDFGKYVDSLGGIFKKWRGYQKPPKSKEEYQERVQYVMGLMAIWKFCYWNGKTWWYFMNSSSKSFYRSQYKKCNTRSVEALCKGEGARTTNCNYGIDSLLIHFGMFKCGTAIYDRWRNGNEVKSKKDLVPGDLVHMFTTKQGDKWNKADWKHIAIVYEVTDDKIWLADFGNRFIKTGTPFHYMTKDGEKTGGEYDYFWKALHIMDLTSSRDAAIEFYASQVRMWDNFKKTPGFTEAYNIYNDYLENSWIDDAADYVLDGKAGSGEQRKAFFGSEYTKVQERVNHIIHMAEDVITGKYGSGEVRKKALGKDYDIIQREVNRILDH